MARAGRNKKDRDALQASETILFLNERYTYLRQWDCAKPCAAQRMHVAIMSVRETDHLQEGCATGSSPHQVSAPQTVRDHRLCVCVLRIPKDAVFISGLIYLFVLYFIIITN